MKVLEKKDRHRSGAGPIGDPGRSGRFVARRFRCPNCLSTIETEVGDGYKHVILGHDFKTTHPQQQVVWLAVCPNCGYDKLGYLDKHGN